MVYLHFLHSKRDFGANVSLFGGAGVEDGDNIYIKSILSRNVMIKDTYRKIYTSQSLLTLSQKNEKFSFSCRGVLIVYLHFFR